MLLLVAQPNRQLTCTDTVLGKNNLWAPAPARPHRPHLLCSAARGLTVTGGTTLGSNRSTIVDVKGLSSFSEGALIYFAVIDYLSVLQGGEIINLNTSRLIVEGNATGKCEGGTRTGARRGGVR